MLASAPVFGGREIIDLLYQLEIPNVTQENLSSPTTDFVSYVYSSILLHLDPLGEDPGQAAFGGLDLLDNPDHHRESIRVANWYCKIKDIFSEFGLSDFTIKDLLKPDPYRTIRLISSLLNFCIFREEKLNLMSPIIGDGSSQEELEMRRSELTKEMLELEVASQMEEPIVQALDAEVKELQQTIHALNKQQVALKTSFRNFKDKTNEINDKISNADFQLVKSAQENSTLQSKIVQSPDKLQRALEEKRSTLAKLKNSERSAMQSFQERAATIELYSKAHKKLSKSLAEMKGIQEQVNSSKIIEKEVKVLKARLSDENLMEMALEAKRVELQGKVEQAEKLTRTLEKEKELRHAELIKERSVAESEFKLKLHELESRQKNAEATVIEANNVHLETKAVRDSGEATLLKLGNKCEELVNELHNYSSSVDAFLERL